MTIGIIGTGEPPAALAAQFGTYATMICRFLGDTHRYKTFRAMDGQLPGHSDCEAFVTTGSACSAYDDQEWIAELEDFLRSARYHAPLVGICFGHQIMAQAFGGRVEKASQGWGLGLHRYELRGRAA